MARQLRELLRAARVSVRKATQQSSERVRRGSAFAARAACPPPRPGSSNSLHRARCPAARGSSACARTRGARPPERRAHKRRTATWQPCALHSRARRRARLAAGAFAFTHACVSSTISFGAPSLRTACFTRGCGGKSRALSTVARRSVAAPQLRVTQRQAQALATKPPHGARACTLRAQASSAWSMAGPTSTSGAPVSPARSAIAAAAQRARRAERASS